MLRSNYPNHEFSPRYLTKEEMENPHIVFEQFFSNINLPAARSRFRNLLTTLVTESFSIHTVSGKKDLIHFEEWLEKLMEAAHVIHEQKKK